MAKSGVSILGIYAADLAFTAQRQPVMGETLIGSKFAMGPGGKGSNQSVAAARAGAKVTFISKLGKDAFGDQALAMYAKEGIAARIPQDPNHSTGAAYIFLEEGTGSNAIIVVPGAAGVISNAGSIYLDFKSHVLRDFISNRINELFPHPIVQVTGSHLVHVAVNQINDKKLVSLMNIAGEHANSKAIGFDEIPPLHNLTVELKTPVKPSKIILQPEGRSLDIDFKKGVSKVIVPELEIYSILEVAK